MLLQSADVCLADLCELLHCDHFVQGHGSSFKSFQQRTAPCRPKLKGQLKHHCQVSVCASCLLHILNAIKMLLNCCHNHLSSHAASKLKSPSVLTCNDMHWSRLLSHVPGVSHQPAYPHKSSRVCRMLQTCVFPLQMAEKLC